MNTLVQILNFLGVVALAVLSGIQWRNDSRLHHRIIDLEKARLQQIDKIATLEKSLQEKSTDLEDFRQRLKISEAAEIDEAHQLADSQARCAQLTSERDQLKSMLDKWIEAVRLRDEAIKTDKEQIEKLVRQRKDATDKFNDVAQKYNDLVKEVEARTAQTQPASGAP
jgi:prefoldin subunit 5